MPVDISVLGAKDTEEAKDAIVLRDEWKNQLRSGSGKIVLVPNALLFGYRRREHDIIAIGSLDNPVIVRNVKTRFHNSKDEHFTNMNVYVHNFVIHIETKSHDVDGIKFNGATASVRYREGWQDVSYKSHQQKSDLVNYLKEHTGQSPFVVNIIWFTSLMDDQFPDVPHNFLGAVPSFASMMRLACLQCFPYKSKKKGYANYYAYNKSGFDSDSFAKALDLFSTTLPQTGALTRKKVEKISKRDARQARPMQSIGNKMVILKGRAGTGKTMRLVHWINILASEEGKRCLLLTYNSALVSDIKRLLTLAGIDKSIGADDIEVKTVHSWIYRLAVTFGVYNSGEDSFLDRFNDIKSDILEYIKMEIDDIGLESLINRHPDELSFDVVAIDEAQDWPDDERQIVSSLVPSEKFVIADGVDQMVRRGVRKQKWSSGNKPHAIPLRTSLRQKTNIIRFVQRFSDELGYSWDVKTNRELPGGRIVVLQGDYSKNFHEVEFGRCKNAGNLAYEYLFLCPPNLVSRSGERRFVLQKQFDNMGIKLWDGTNKKLRKSFPTSADEHRILQYDSCRGLEGWTVCCLGFDELLEYKKREFNKIEEEQLSLLDGLGLSSKEERAAEFVAQWATMPLTRAVDTLILQISRKETSVSKILQKISRETSLVIEWVDGK